MFIFHGGLNQDASPEQMQNNMNKWFAWVEKLNKDGRYVSGEALLPGGKLVTGKNTATDGPYTEGKEIVGGFFVVNAANIEEATAIAQEGYPDFEYGGTVQVRPVVKFDM